MIPADGQRMRRLSTASDHLADAYRGVAGAGDIGAGAAPVVPDDVMMSATRRSFGSINKISLLSNLANS
jgi:hypothetical protein